jgi:hypothetical protein
MLSPDSAGETRFACRRTATNSTNDYSIAPVMPAWTAGIHPVRSDASEDIHVNLGSGTPCRNDGAEKYSLKSTKIERGEQTNTENRRSTLSAITVADALALKTELLGSSLLRRLLTRLVHQI